MRKLTLLTLALATYAGVNAQQTSDAKNHTVTIDIKSRIDITVTAGPTLTFATSTDFGAAKNTEATPSTVTVNSNKAYDLTIQASTTNFVPRSTVTTAMPASVLKWKKTGGSYASLSDVTPGEIITAAPKAVGQTYSITYEANVGYTYDAAIYDLVVVFTATQN
jgi:hypothetical protein